VNKYKVGIVGAGGVTELHFKGYREHPERIEIAAVCGLNFELANAKADQYGVAQRFSNLDDFIRTSRVDVVVVCTPSTVRKPAIFPLIEAAIDSVHTWKHSVSREKATYEGLDQLLVSLETGIEAPNSAKDNLRTVAMLDAAYVSAKDQRIVRLVGGRIA
jgi:predicted dehydrogenase